MRFIERMINLPFTNLMRKWGHPLKPEVKKANPINRKPYEIETAKLELVEAIDGLAQAKSSNERIALFKLWRHLCDKQH